MRQQPSALTYHSTDEVRWHCLALIIRFPHPIRWWTQSPHADHQRDHHAFGSNSGRISSPLKHYCLHHCFPATISWPYLTLWSTIAWCAGFHFAKKFYLQSACLPLLTPSRMIRQSQILYCGESLSGLHRCGWMALWDENHLCQSRSPAPNTSTDTAMIPSF